jgi:hypothetical protein
MAHASFPIKEFQLARVPKCNLAACVSMNDGYRGVTWVLSFKLNGESNESSPSIVLPGYLCLWGVRIAGCSYNIARSVCR